jgi:replicative DNA helicase
MAELPHNLEAERAVLAAITRFPETLDAVGDLEPADFYGPAHGRLFAACQRLSRKGKPIDPVALAGEGIAMDLVASVGDSIGTPRNADFYAREVKTASARRNLLLTAAKLAQAARGDKEVAEVINEGIRALQACHRGESPFRHIRDVAKEWYESAKLRAEKPDEAPPLGVPTGITELNDYLAFSGLARGHLTVVGAESSQGKSALLDNSFALPAALAGQSVCLCSLEDDAKSVFVRNLSSRTGLQNRQLQQENVGMAEWDGVNKVTQEIVDTDLWVMDVVPAGVDVMIAQIRRHLQERPADLLGIDYLQFVRAGVKTESQTAASEYVIEAIANMAREFKTTATVLLSQYRKLKDGAIPTDDDLRNANAVRYFAHAIIHIWCPEKAKRLGCKTLMLTKNKNGPTGNITVGWKPQTVTFCDPEESDKRQYLIALGGKA